MKDHFENIQKEIIDTKREETERKNALETHNTEVIS